MNKFSTSSAQIGEGLQRSASSLRVANSTVEESIALFTAGQEIAQDSEKVGTALNALSMRIRGKVVPPYEETCMLCVA